MNQALERSPLLAVYGTLIEGHGNWRHYLNTPATIKLEEGLTVSGYSMRTFGGYPAIFEASPDSEVHVEVFDLSELGDDAEDVLARIDRMECGAGYIRRLETLSNGDSAWVYVMPIDEAEYFQIAIPDGNWETFLAERGYI